MVKYFVYQMILSTYYVTQFFTVFLFFSITYVLFTIRKGRGRMGVPYIHLFVYICWSYRMIALMLCYQSIAPSTCKEDISASAICHLWMFILIDWYIGRSSLASSCHFSGLSYIFHINLMHHVAVSWLYARAYSTKSMWFIFTAQKDFVVRAFVK